MSGIFGAQQGRFGRVTLFDIRAPVAVHAHPHVHLLFKVAGSNRGLQVGEERVFLEDDNCLLINPWQRHFDIEEFCTEPTIMLALYIDLSYLRSRYGTLTNRIFSDASGPLSVSGRELVSEIAGILGSSNPPSPDRLEDAIVELVEASLRGAGSNEETRAAVFDYRIRRAMALLREHPHLHPDLESVASSVGLSRSRFFEQFKNSVGIAPTMYMDGLLLEQAIAMLGDADRSIEEISTSLGFSAQSSFSRFFKDRVGFPPALLRHAVLPH